MSEKIAVLGFSWILSWGFAAVQQLSITYDHIVHNQSNVQIVTTGPSSDIENKNINPSKYLIIPQFM